MNAPAAAARLSAVLFDLDGTLLDTAPDFVTAVNRLRAEHGLGGMPSPAIRATVSHGARALVRLAFGIADEDRAFEPLRQRLLALYQEHLFAETAPFPGMAALIAALAARGVRWGVVTNKPNYLAEPLLAHSALAPPAAVLVCPDHVTRTKPDPEPLLLACARLGCRATEVIYVGDHARDIEAGRNAGMPTIAATYGYLEPGETVADWGADYEADSVAAIARILFDRFLLT
ncbi:MAG: N-acetylmuramic acid 6-phosphate phosphatase [Pseudomonadales bacterium]|nr:N-acetylmuramic acid 6-phosphate phosphatase [Pseudomonadales bacterium]